MTVFDREMDRPDSQPIAFIGNQRYGTFAVGLSRFPVRTCETWHILFRIIETVFHRFGFPGSKIPSLSILSATGFFHAHTKGMIIDITP